MSNLLRKIKRNKARALGLPLKFFLDSYQARLRLKIERASKKAEKLSIEMKAILEAPAEEIAGTDDESGRQV